MKAVPESLDISVWRLKAGLEKKFAKGHPWVFSSDLDQSPKGILPGSWVELRSASNQFLAFGYGNPSTLISFRELSRTPIVNGTRIAASVLDEALRSLVAKKLEDANRLRTLTGVNAESHRLIFGEADGLPGVIIDAYRIEGGGVVYVIQCSTAGADTLLPTLVASLQAFHRGSAMAIVVARDSSSRSMEGISKHSREVIGGWEGLDPKRSRIRVRSATGNSKSTEAVCYWVNFIEGQKTGFFLDQRLNVRLAAPLFSEVARRAKQEGRSLKTLDLFSYVGQWTTQIVAAATAVNANVECTLADASTAALDLARENAEEAVSKDSTARVTALAQKLDLLKDLSTLPVANYDIVICDPPAFVKKKKDLPTGVAAYQKLNREAIRRVKPGGVFVSCSCSGLVTDEDFDQALSNAIRSSGRTVHWIARGGHGEDHPYSPLFPQGRYLKGWIGVVD